MSVLSELETAIGVLPGNNVDIGADYSKRTALRAWLVANGVDSKRVANMQDSTLITAYKSSSYLDSVRSDKHGFSRKSRANGASFVNFDDESAETTSARNSTSAIFDEPKSDPTPIQAPEQSLTTTAAALAKAADAVMGPKFAQAKRELEASLDEKLRNAKLELSPDAKLMLRQIAQDSAREAFESWLPPKRIEICDKFTNNVVDMGIQHEMFPTLLRACMACDASGNRLNIWLNGQPGSGKTHAAKMVAKALKLDFAADSSLDADYKIVGFKNSLGEFQSTEFLRVYISGGVYIADEIDNWNPSALVALNSATANGFISTPDGMKFRHPDCIIIACANTWGLGATNEFVGRTRLDAASLDRFQPKIHWTNDEKLERAVAQNQGGEIGTEWFNTVRSARNAAKTQGLKIIISPRATYSGISLLQQGFTKSKVTLMTITASLSDEQAKSIGLPKTVPVQPETPVTTNLNEMNITIRRMWNDGEKIAAIKFCREASGNIGLREAKDYCEALMGALA